MLRCGIELCARSARVRAFLDEVGPGESGEYAQLIRTIRSALDEVQQLFPSTVQNTVLSSPDGETEARALADYLERFSRWFVTIHELLVYLPAHPVLPETVTTLQATFGDALFKQHSPSILAGSLFNAAEFDFLEILQARLPDLSEILLTKESNIVLQLALCDRGSPTAWPVLAHEMGHAVDFEGSIATAALESIVKDKTFAGYEVLLSWTREFCADLIAARAVGPTSIVALLELEYCVLPMSSQMTWSRTHPSTRIRLQVAAEYLAELTGADATSLVREREFYEDAWTLVAKRAHTDVQRLRDDDTTIVEGLIRPLVRAIVDHVNELPIPVHTTQDESLLRCQRRLREGLPISAQGLSREYLQERLTEYAKKPDPEAFKKLTGEFREQPLGVPTILQACHEFREERIQAAIGDDGAILGSTEGIEDLTNDLLRLDALAVSSIRTSSVHRHLIQHLPE